MIDLTIIIVSWNTKKLLKDCLDSIFSQTKGINFEVIVVDNGSTDDSVGMIEELRIKNKELRIIKNKENLGFARANDQALRQAQGEYILLLNSDTKIVGNAFKKLVDFAKSKDNLAALGCRLLNLDGSLQPSVAPFFTLPKVFLWLLTGDRFLYSSPGKASSVDWVMGAALMVKKEVIKKVGLLDEKFFMYMEEVEWCYRIKKAGFEIWFYPGAEIFHLVRGSSPEGEQRAILGIYQGLIYFYQKHFALWELSVLKFLLKAKAAGAWFVGILTGSNYLKQTYAKAFKLF